MKISLPRSEMKEMIAGLGRIVGSNTTLPVLACLRFSSHGAVTTEGTDLDSTARYRFSNATTDGDGQFVIPLQAVKTLITKGNGQDLIELETLPLHRVNVTNRIGSQSVSQSIVGLDPEDWPPSNVEVQTQPGDGFIETYRKAVPFASTDETRYVLNAVHIDVAGTGEHSVTMVATDGRRLSCWNSMALPISLPTTIPITKFLQWPGLSGEVSIGIATEREKLKGKLKGIERVTHFALEAGPWSYVTKAIEGHYPNWRQVVPDPDSCRNKVTFTDPDIATLRNVLPGLAGRDRKSATIVLQPGDDGGVVITEQQPRDYTTTRLELSGGSRFEGRDPVAVNAMFLCDALAADFKEFMYQDDLCPLRSGDGQGGTHVLMPVKIMVEPKPIEVPGQAPVQEPTVETNPEQQQVPVSVEVKAEQAKEPVETTMETIPPTIETVADNNKEKASMPENKVTKTEVPGMETTPLDKVLAAYEVAKQKVREANQALAEIADAVKAAVKDQRQQKQEVENVRAALGKLQAIRV